MAESPEKEARKLLEARSFNQIACGTLHQALDAYSAYITQKYEGKSNQRPQQRLVALLKKHSVGVALDKFDADAIDQWLALWCKRPTGEAGPLALTTCRNTMIGLRHLIRWHARSVAFQWEMPRGYSFPRCRIDTAPSPTITVNGNCGLKPAPPWSTCANVPTTPSTPW